MGPRPFSRGNQARGGGVPSIQDGLQWGRDLSVAETDLTLTVTDTFSLTLQWGRDLSVAETR